MLKKADLESIRMIMREELQEFRKEFKAFKAEIKDEMLTFKDYIAGVIKDLQDEITIVVGYNDRLEDHESRIEKIEKRIIHN